MSSTLEKKIQNYINFSQCNFDSNSIYADRIKNKNPNKIPHALGAVGCTLAGSMIGGAVGMIGGSATSSIGSVAGAVAGAYLGWEKWGRKEVDSSRYYAFKLNSDGTFTKKNLIGDKNGYASKEEALRVIGDKDNCKALKGSTLITDYSHLFH